MQAAGLTVPAHTCFVCQLAVAAQQAVVTLSPSQDCCRPFVLCMQNTESGNGPDANPKVGDISYIRDKYFQTVYDQANSAMTATSPMSTLRGKTPAFQVSVWVMMRHDSGACFKVHTEFSFRSF